MSDGTLLVTGGSRGIGRTIVETLVRDGRQVSFTYREGEAAARELEERSAGRASAYRFDLSDHEAAEELVSEVEERDGFVEGLVNNAGVHAQCLLAMTSTKRWDEVMDINLGGPFRCCRAVLRGMITRRRGAIVSVASLGAIRGVAGLSVYGASKAGILGMTRSLAREVGKRGIRVNAVIPGFVATDMTAELGAREVEGLRAAECLPGGVDADCVAETVAFLLSPKACSITGQAWVVDAGVSA
ncbi:MAG: SDR family NAD(P)-dependent oxidoreductase [Planctomycetota bacterium]